MSGRRRAIGDQVTTGCPHGTKRQSSSKRRRVCISVCSICEARWGAGSAALARRRRRPRCSFQRPAPSILRRAARMRNEPGNLRGCSWSTTICTAAPRSRFTRRYHAMRVSGPGRSLRSRWRERSRSCMEWRAMRAHSRGQSVAVSVLPSAPGHSRTAVSSSRADAAPTATSVVRSSHECRSLRHGDASLRYHRGLRGSAVQRKPRHLHGCPCHPSETWSVSHTSC